MLRKVEAVLENCLLPMADELDPVQLYVSLELVHDIKALGDGFDNDLLLRIANAASPRSL